MNESKTATWHDCGGLGCGHQPCICDGAPSQAWAHTPAQKAGAWAFPSGSAHATKHLDAPSHARFFVCQGCGKAGTALHGRAILCGCGTTSAAEVLT